MKIHQHNAGHMTNTAAMPIYGKSTLKIFFQEPWADFDETLYTNFILWFIVNP